MRKVLLAAAITALGVLSGCSKAPDEAASNTASAPPAAPAFNVAQCLPGLEVATGDGVMIPVGGCVASPTKTFVMVMTPAGTLDIMPVTAGVLGAPIWSTLNHGASPGSANGYFQSDGNLVIYDTGSKPIWNTESFGAKARYKLDLSDLGELLIHNPEGKAIWSSKTGLASKAAPAT